MKAYIGCQLAANCQLSSWSFTDKLCYTNWFQPADCSATLIAAAVYSRSSPVFENTRTVVQWPASRDTAKLPTTLPRAPKSSRRYKPHRLAHTARTEHVRTMESLSLNAVDGMIFIVSTTYEIDVLLLVDDWWRRMYNDKLCSYAKMHKIFIAQKWYWACRVLSLATIRRIK